MADDSVAPAPLIPTNLPDSPEKENSQKAMEPSNLYLNSWPLAIVTFSLCLGTFLVALDINIIGVAVPKISAVFDSLDDIAWYGSAYLLTVTAFQPIMGFIFKYFNVRATYLTSIIIFEGKKDISSLFVPFLHCFCSNRSTADTVQRVLFCALLHPVLMHLSWAEQSQA